MEPGASEVFTHGLGFRPRAAALRASRPAPIITDGFDVFVHEVMAAITTCPWSSSVSVPSASVTGVVAETRSAIWTPPVSEPAASPRSSGGCAASCGAVGSLAGNVSSSGSSHESASGTKPSSDMRNDALDSVSETRSCGRLGPAREGTTSARSSSSVSEYVGVSERSSCQRPCALA